MAPSSRDPAAGLVTIRQPDRITHWSGSPSTARSTAKADQRVRQAETPELDDLLARTANMPLATWHSYSAWSAQRGAAICRALTVRDSQGSGLVAVRGDPGGCPRWPSRSQAQRSQIHVDKSPGTVRQCAGRSVAALRLKAVGSVLVSFTPVRGRSPATAGPTSALAGTLTAGGE